ncbi:MAG: YafY family transcriptional regulator [Acidobacteria bacterium]|nr:YafY family transcriptional regulator [Acidobacteriota bacterium]
MRRADRLFQIILHLRHRRFMTAAQLADALQVSVRTIYRDVADLSGSGVPILGEAGVGYMLAKEFDFPPLMFDREEIEALTLGARMVSAWGGASLSAAASRVLAKVDAALPDSLKPVIEATTLFAPDFHIGSLVLERTDILRQALHARLVVRFDYTNRKGEASRRDVHPLGMYFWGSTWSLAAWCVLRGDFRNFRLDRMVDLVLTEKHFDDDPERNLSAFIRQYD